MELWNCLKTAEDIETKLYIVSIKLNAKIKQKKT